MPEAAELLELVGRFLGGAPPGETDESRGRPPGGLRLLARVSGPAPRRTVRESPNGEESGVDVDVFAVMLRQ